MDLDKIKKLIEFVGSSRISDLTVAENGTTVRITRTAERSRPSRDVPRQDSSEDAPKPDLVPGEPMDESTVSASAKPMIIASPSFGLFHRAPRPGAAPFVEVGDEIVKGQELFIIEAMKVFNTITAERSGKVAKILINDGEDVELGQPLLEIA